MVINMRIDEAQLMCRRFLILALTPIQLLACLALVLSSSRTIAQEYGLISKLGTRGTVPLVPITVADGSLYWFVLSIESDGVGLFKNTTAGQALMSKVGVDPSAANRFDQLAVDFDLNLLTKAFSPKVIKFVVMELPDNSETAVPTDVAGIVGLRIVPQEVIEFSFVEGKIFLRNSDEYIPKGKSLDLYNDFSGGYALALPLTESRWLFELSSLSRSSMCPALFSEIARRGPDIDGRWKQLGLPISGTAKVGLARENSLSVFAIDAESVAIDKSAMKLFFVEN